MASAGRLLDVGWATVWAQIENTAKLVVDDPHWVGPVAHLGPDETVMWSATRHRSRRFFTTAVGAATSQIMHIINC